MMSRIERPARLAAVLLVTLAVAACAGTQNRHTDPERDPWEGYNRKIHSFNMKFDRYLGRPVAVAYDTVMPDPLQRGVANFFRNLDYPVTFFNQLMQGKFRESGISTSRFLFNTVFGLLGFFDVATRVGMPAYDEDFGQTLATWGWTDSRYLVMPFLGPFTVRDTLGRSFYGYLHPISYAIREEDMYAPLIIDLIQRRASFLDADAALEEAYDPYTLVRDSYLQNREFKIYDGDPPVTDYDAFLEDEP
ncbi:MAG: VacJ family lipoprotein [Xanthomonadales bacterium]|nr:VacJ family lipoprotein [Xanthomonadales bacterium]NIN75393.1 VacJ family lipoprotein [Xanthomonadales bacterium]NIP12418.1 VacJ family lipoprotein [Xanthomonadales bacterium]NIQ36047.1 VacJ family lipoprotein [Xanthomonadales bacterium]NIT34099.1 VacJ family lipoprotein [Xanthomonadales bacterium]